jgi:hypothetical protein
VHSKSRRPGEVEESMSTNNDGEPPVDLFRKAADLYSALETQLAGEHDTTRDPQPTCDLRPRGLTDQGLVRTTGWLQLGTHPVSSGLITAIICLLVSLVAAIALLPAYPVLSGLCVLLIPAAGYGVWHLVTTRLAPASTAHNIGTTPAGQLHPGIWVRLHGTIGPVGQVAHVHPERDDPPSTDDSADVVHVTFTGGIRKTWSGDHQLHIAELHN